MQNPLTAMKIRKEKLNNTFGRVRNQGKRPHQGWDIEASVGTPVFAIARGIVKWVEAGGNKGDYGKQICLEFEHKGKMLFAHYAHLSAVWVKANDWVEEGQQLGITGKTGNAKNLRAEEDHLHFEIREKGDRHMPKGLRARKDPGDVLGYEIYSCR